MKKIIIVLVLVLLGVGVWYVLTSRNTDGGTASIFSVYAEQSPTNVAARDASSNPRENKITITWTDPSVKETAIEICRSTSASFDQANSICKTLPANTISYEDTNSVPDVTYYYRVRAIYPQSGLVMGPTNGKSYSADIWGSFDMGSKKSATSTYRS